MAQRAMDGDASVDKPGYLVGLSTLDSETCFDSLPVDGHFPEWLEGTLVRNGPAKFEIGEEPIKHWFDGLAMLHKFSFGEGRVSYANRFLRSAAYRDAEAGRMTYREFASDPCRSLFKRVATMFRPRPTDNCNINLARLGDEYVAMSETPLPIGFDLETLDALGVSHTPPGQHTTAHPHHDPAHNELIAYAVHFGIRTSYRLYAQRDASSQRQLGRLAVSEPSYMHSFALTPRYAVLVAFPFVVNPRDLALSGRPFIENYRWKPGLGTSILVFDREDGKLRGSYEAEPFFAFHHVNAFERGSELVLDMVAYDTPSLIDSLYLERLETTAPPQALQGRLRRYTVSRETGGVAAEDLSETPLELPRIDYGRCNTRDYRYVYGVGVHPAGERGEFLDQLVKIDVKTGDTQVWRETGAYVGEPVFVPKPTAERDEDDGVLLSVVLDRDSATSFLLALDALSLEELGRAKVPHRIPFGFHGQYFE